ncbi:Uncharacterized protein FWK35_00033730 [Aphis craccivora]|uniref:Uncharacterized protein n=1 Tax=Aphis craccivora TaxID=307492 RepID=A0A6G0VT82_APHCR|nr:Uncharacterized protein FWK35_00033730 [Aphis craccivora]
MFKIEHANSGKTLANSRKSKRSFRYRFGRNLMNWVGYMKLAHPNILAGKSDSQILKVYSQILANYSQNFNTFFKLILICRWAKFMDVPNRESQKIRVCKNFFLSCLVIISLTPPDEQRGKQSYSKIPNERKAFAYEHINSYPTVQSHYCRADTNKKYLTSDLNISKMYDQYVSVCLAQNKIPVEKHMFRFFSPKKDLCEICVEFDTLSKTGLTDSDKVKCYENHITSKDMMRIERDNDKIIDSKTAVVCFDLENVLTLPKTNVGCAFYKRKLNCYNLTAHLNLNGQIYCAIWNEGLVGRSGNDLASAIVSCLEQIIEDHRSIEKIITWSDSCVPQNRNSLISCAVINLMMRHPNITSVHMKYSIPGHIWSPIGLTRVLLKVNRKKPFKTLQMRQDHFKNYYEMAKPFKFSLIPFASVAQLFFSKINRSIIQYKTCHGIDEFILVNISSQTKSSHVLWKLI